jgi:hypothetical protein
VNIKYDYKTIPYQGQFHNSRKPKAYLSTGYGGGKTYALVMKMFWLMNENKNVPGGILAPTLKMFKRDVAPTILDICRENKIPFKYNKSDSFYLFPSTNSLVYVFHSEDDGASIKGPNLGWFVVNEIASCSRTAFLNAVGRIRHKGAKLPQIAVSGTPESFNWCWEYFWQEPRPDTELIIGDARANKFVLPDYFKGLEESYDELMRQMYIEGRPVNLQGKAAIYNFDRKIHAAEETKYDPIYPIWVALDFNVSPMSASVWQYKPGIQESPDRFVDKPRLDCLFEITMRDANTWAFCDVLQTKLDELGVKQDEVVIYPDPAGIARSTKSHVSDFDILRDRGYKQIKYKTKLSVRDCINAVNSIFAKGVVRIHNKNCPNLISDLEQCRFKDGAFEIDKSNPDRSHWLDGLKNMVDYEFPVRKYSPARSQLIR